MSRQLTHSAVFLAAATQAVLATGRNGQQQIDSAEAPDTPSSATSTKRPVVHHEAPEGHARERTYDGDITATGPAAVITRGQFTSIQANIDLFGNNILGDAARGADLSSG